jgi:hypothetical protein
MNLGLTPTHVQANTPCLAATLIVLTLTTSPPLISYSFSVAFWLWVVSSLASKFLDGHDKASNT